MAISIHQIYGSIFKLWRVKRLRLFAQKLQPVRTDKLVDIGGYPRFWTSSPPLVGSIDCINLHKQPWDEDSFQEYKIQTLIGNACDLEIADGAHDIAFSNSVIEHVGTWEDQVAFAREIRRVGDALWVQTPAYECPIEPHYLAPFVHWLPKPVQRKMLRHFTPWGLIAKPPVSEIDLMVDTTRLLRRREMVELFPDCTIHTERLLGFIPKSYIAIRKRTPKS
jgi:Methyltransferase domain